MMLDEGHPSSDVFAAQIGFSKLIQYSQNLIARQLNLLSALELDEHLLEISGQTMAIRGPWFVRTVE
jgi:hypothetical protein